VIANAVALALMGMLLGPLYPIMIELISFRIIPRSIQTFGIGYIVSYGCAGSALFPYIIGVIIQKYGAKALAPILVITLCVQFIAFLFLGIPGLRNSSAGEAQRAIE
jgi:fucose permease